MAKPSRIYMISKLYRPRAEPCINDAAGWWHSLWQPDTTSRSIISSIRFDLSAFNVLDKTGLDLVSCTLSDFQDSNNRCGKIGSLQASFTS